MKAQALSILLFGLSAANVLADTGSSRAIWGESMTRVAQLSAEERRSLMQRWESMSEEDKSALRQEMRDSVQNLPPEERERRRKEVLERWGEKPAQERGTSWREWEQRRGTQADEPRPQPGPEGFGQGYERRGIGRDRPGRR